VTTPAAMTNPAPRSEKAVDRNGDRVLLAIAIDGALRSMIFDRIAKQTV